MNIYGANTKKLHRRLQSLEKKVVTGLVELHMPDGSVRRIKGGSRHAFELFDRAYAGDRSGELAWIEQASYIVEPGGGRLLELLQVMLPGPVRPDPGDITPAPRARPIKVDSELTG